MVALEPHGILTVIRSPYPHQFNILRGHPNVRTFVIIGREGDLLLAPGSSRGQKLDGFPPYRGHIIAGCT